MESMEFRASLGKDNKTFLAFSREFLWQEGHTIHATYEEAEQRTLTMLKVYQDFIRDSLAIPFVSGRKAENEKFRELRILTQ